MKREEEATPLQPFTCTTEFCMKAGITQVENREKTVEEELAIIKSIHEKHTDDHGESQ